MFDMHFDLTNMYTFKLNVFKMAANRTNDVTKITKPMVVARTATMRDFYAETASMLLLMTDEPVTNLASTIIFAIRDNRLKM